jgi:hypothetical protein
MIDLSICVAGIRTDRWKRFGEQVIASASPYKVELIFCGPQSPKNLKGHVFDLFIPSHRCPTACVQEAILNAKGQLVCWLSDDAEILEDSLMRAVDTWYEQQFELNHNKIEIVLPYFEGDNTQKGSIYTQPPEYWTIHYHGSLRLPGIRQWYLTAPCGLLSREYFLELGGFDCRFEHINMSCHDLSIRIQNDGGNIFIPPKYVMDCEFSHNVINGRCDCVLCEAYIVNDLPLFQSIYTNPEAVNRVKIDIENYKNTPEKWRRFTR